MLTTSKGPQSWLGDRAGWVDSSFIGRAIIEISSLRYLASSGKPGLGQCWKGWKALLAVIGRECVCKLNVSNAWTLRVYVFSTLQKRLGIRVAYTFDWHTHSVVDTGILCMMEYFGEKVFNEMPTDRVV